MDVGELCDVEEEGIKDEGAREDVGKPFWGEEDDSKGEMVGED